MKVHEYLAAAINRSGKSQTEIAKLAGFPRSNMVSMIKTGACRLPPRRIIDVAKALNLDPQHLFRLCMQEYDPELFEVIHRLYKEAA